MRQSFNLSEFVSKCLLFVFCAFAGQGLLLKSALGLQSATLPSEFLFPQGKVQLIAGDSQLGVLFELNPEWHIYWKNSGDSGASPIWNWALNSGQIGKEFWPVPKRIHVESLINFGYEKEALFLFSLENKKSDLKQDSDSQNLKAIKLDLEFLVCKVECIPYFAKLQALPDQQNESKLQLWRSKFVYPEDDQSKLGFQLEAVHQNLNALRAKLKIPSEFVGKIKSFEIFPVNGNDFSSQAPILETPLSHSQDFLYFVFQLQDSAQQDLTGSRFLLVIETAESQNLAFEVVLNQEKNSLILILVWALLGGFILNLMPCVFPVLSIKVLSFLGPGKDSAALKKAGLFYSMGVITSFVILGLTLLILRSAGEQIGWGFQLQSPSMTAAISLLFFWLGLNFLGFFEIGLRMTSLGNHPRESNKEGWLSSFFTGVLATVVATPCTAPFMGAALGASLALPTMQSLLVFFILGLGMALPFLFLAYFPLGLKYLPKPGLWMQKLKEFLAFPMFATMLWLLWVTSSQAGQDILLLLFSLFIAIGFWIWLVRFIKNEKWHQWFLLIGFLFSISIVFIIPVESSQQKSSGAQVELWQEFSLEKVKADVAEGKSVFIDFTAAWCITCQVNKKLVLSKEEVMEAFVSNGVQLYRADWTEKEESIAKALEYYGRNSLPVYVFYPAGNQQFRLLPEILTKQLILETINRELVICEDSENCKKGE